MKAQAEKSQLRAMKFVLHDPRRNKTGLKTALPVLRPVARLERLRRRLTVRNHLNEEGVVHAIVVEG
ncbi:MAG: hypothetical protein Kow0059_09030 [Candidatus Sumerlaeia bacterium]